MARVLIVEDNRDIREVVAEYLKLNGHSAVELGEAAGAADLARSGTIDLCIIDVMIPGGSGFQLAKTIRESSTVPIIFLTARTGETDRITGFELGADDYVTKPFSPRELVLRVEALLRRGGQPEATPQNFRRGKELLEIDPAGRRVRVNGSDVRVTETEFRFVELLVQHPGAAQSRESLMLYALEYHVDTGERTVDTHIKNLRQKLGNPSWIETVRGYGYRFAGEKSP